jgi:hypothetical protein
MMRTLEKGTSCATTQGIKAEVQGRAALEKREPQGRKYMGE